MEKSWKFEMGHNLDQYNALVGIRLDNTERGQRERKKIFKNKLIAAT